VCAVIIFLARHMAAFGQDMWWLLGARVCIHVACNDKFGLAHVVTNGEGLVATHGSMQREHVAAAKRQMGASKRF